MRRRTRTSDNPWPALSDLMVGFLFVIFLLLMIAILKEEVKKKDIYRGMIKRLMAEASGIVEVDPDDGRIRIGQDKLTFAHNSAKIPPEGEELLNRLIPVIGGIVTDTTYNKWIGKIAVEGHTSSVGSDQVNWNLSAARAIAVTQYILEHSDPNQLQVFEDKIEAIGRSDRDLILDDTGAENEDQSRRIEIKLLFMNPEEWR